MKKEIVMTAKTVEEAVARAAEALPDTAVVLDWAEGCLERGRVESYEMRVAVN